MSQLKTALSFIVTAGLALFLSSPAFSITEEIADRLKPVGDVCMSGDDCAAAPVAAAASSEPRSGSAVYDSKCVTCHGTGAAGAPKFADAGAWAPRIGQGMDTLYTHAIGGFNGMPAKGLCMDCSDDEVKAAVDYIVENSQ